MSQPKFRQGDKPKGKFDKPNEKFVKKEKKPDPTEGMSSKEKKQYYKKLRNSKKKHAEAAEVVNKVFTVNVSHMKSVDRLATLEKTLTVSKGKMADLCFRHDTARALQLVIKYGSAAQRDQVFGELRGRILSLVRDKTGHFVVLKLAQYCTPAQRSLILNELRGSLRKISLTADGAQVLDQLYMTGSKPDQYCILREFLDQEFALFSRPRLSVAASSATAGDAPVGKDGKPKALDKTALALEAARKALATSTAPISVSATDAEWAKAPEKTLFHLVEAAPERKAQLLDSLEVYLTRAVEKEQLMFRYVHALLLQYLSVASIESAPTREIVSSVCKYPLALHDSRDGALAVVRALGWARAKDRKTFVKMLKGRVVEMATHVDAHLFILRALACIDDVVLLRKSVFSELTAEAPFGTAPYCHQLLVSHGGQQVLRYLAAPTETTSLLTPVAAAAVAPAYAPAYVVNRKDTAADKEDDDDDEKKGKDGDAEGKEGKLDDKDHAWETALSEKARLARRAAEEEEARTRSAAGEAALIKTWKRDSAEKITEIAIAVAPAVLRAALLTSAQVAGVKGAGVTSTSNIEIAGQKKKDAKKNPKFEPSPDGDDDEEDDEKSDEEDEEEAKIKAAQAAAAASPELPFAVLKSHLLGTSFKDAPTGLLACLRYVCARASKLAASGAAAAGKAAKDAKEVTAAHAAAADVIAAMGEIASQAETPADSINDELAGHLSLKRALAWLSAEAPADAGALAASLWGGLAKDAAAVAAGIKGNRFCFIVVSILGAAHAAGDAALTSAILKALKPHTAVLGAAAAAPGAKLLARVVANKGAPVERDSKDGKAAGKKVEEEAPAAKKRAASSKKAEPEPVEEEEEAPVTKKGKKAAAPAAKKAVEKAAEPEEKPAPKRASKKALTVAMNDSDDDEDMPPVAPTPLRRSTRSNPTTPLSSAAPSPSITPRRSARLTPQLSANTAGSFSGMPTLTLPTVAEEASDMEDDDEEEVKPKAGAKKKAAAATPVRKTPTRKSRA